MDNIILGLTTLFMCLAVIGVAYGVFEMAHHSRTVKQIKTAIVQTIRGDEVSLYKDSWGTDIMVHREPLPDNKGTCYIGRSAGKDRSFKTSDDIEVIEVDWNKARIVGNFIGKKSKETFKGLIDGIFSK